MGHGTKDEQVLHQGLCRQSHMDHRCSSGSLLKGISSLMDFATFMTSNYVQLHDIKCTDMAAQILGPVTN